MHNTLVEIRRLLSVLLMPWVLIALFCIVSSWTLLSFLDLHALVAPVLKLFVAAKTLAVKLLPVWLATLWSSGKSELMLLLAEFVSFVTSVVAGWKAWSVKKLFRHVARFIASFSARFVVISVLMNLLFGDERKSLRRLPRYIVLVLHRSWPGKVIRLWHNASDRSKRLVVGMLLAIVLVLVGQAFLGLSILLFDLLWEVVIWLCRLLARFWRWLAPLLMRLVPNTIGNFVTQKLVPMFTDLVPVVRDDHRVMFLRFGMRANFRRFKFWLYRYSRARRTRVRSSIRPLISDQIRTRKANFMDAASAVDPVPVDKDNDGKNLP